jgi:transposase-like protein
VDRDWLAQELERGRSIAAIAREVGLHPATVAYWMNKHGLTLRDPPPPHPSRGGIEEARLRALVERGLSVRQIAAEVGLSATTVRYWLRRFGLQTQPAHYARRDGPKPREIVRECRVHGWAVFRRIGREAGYRCVRCGPARVARRRRKMKDILVAEAGGACRLCGYDRYAGALQFHHLDAAAKRLQFAGRGLTRALEILRQEAKKCVLLCANCHAEVEAGVVPADVLRGSTVSVRGSSTAEQSAVNRKVVGSNPTPGA